jgi:hypothetical protein
MSRGRRAGDAATLSRIARTTTSAIRWALGVGGTPPPIPVSWNWAKLSLADAANQPVCAPAWQTPDVLALARLVQSGGTDALPILADALQDAGAKMNASLTTAAKARIAPRAGCPT